MRSYPLPAERESAFEDRQGSTGYLQALREHWQLVVALIVLAVSVAAIYSFTATKRYEAEADILVSPVSADDTTFIGIGLLRESTQSRSVLTAARIVESPQVARAAAARLGLPPSEANRLLDSVEVKPLEQSNILTVVGKDDTPTGAAATANAFATATIERRSQAFQQELTAAIDRLSKRLDAIPAELRGSPEALAIQTRMADLGSLVGAPDPTLQISSRAVPPDSPVWPRPALSIAVAFLAAALLGIGAAVALHFASPRLLGEDELLLEQRLPILARVPRMSGEAVRGYLTGQESLPPDVRESYRTLRASLATAGRDDEFPEAVLVTSAIPGEGKTMTAANLAVTIAAGGTSVILVDGDLRRPMVSTVFGVAARRHGFGDLLADEVSPEDVLVPAPGHDRLQLIPASPQHAQRVDLLEPRRVERALAQLRLQADVVVLDSPPLTEVADALTLADAVDAVLVCVRLGHSRRDKLIELRRMLAQQHVAPTGFVVITRRRSRSYRYAYAPERGRRYEPVSRDERSRAEAGAGADSRTA